MELPLEDDKFASLQENDLKTWDLHDKVKEGAYSEVYFVKNDVLFRSHVDDGHKFKEESSLSCCYIVAMSFQLLKPTIKVY